MHTLITGGAGFLGVAVARTLLGRDAEAQVVLTDIFEHPRLAALLAEFPGRVSFVKADLTDPAVCQALVTTETSTIHHYASLVSGGAEKDFPAGMAANVHATMHLLEACRLRPKLVPKFIFASSIATFGGADLPAVVDDLTAQHPQNSYGVAKLLGEALGNDYSRKGYCSARAVRLPAVVVRDEPNTAASGYASGLIREPLAGRDYVCPVTPETRLPIISMRACVNLLVGLGDLGYHPLGDWRAINGPGISPSAGEIAAAVQATGAATGRITFAPDPAVMNIVAAWPKVWKSPRADALGLKADASIETIIADYRCGA